MSVKLSSVLKNVASENYDKGNVLTYIILCCITNCIGQSLNFFKTSNKSLIFIFSIIAIICSIIIVGTSILATNNAIHRKKGVFPNPFKEIGRTILVAIEAGFCSSIFWLIPAIILMVVCSIFFAGALLKSGSAGLSGLGGMLIISSIIMIIFFIFCVLLYYASYLNFVTTLKIGDFLNIKKGFNLLGKIKRKLVVLIIIVASICAVSGFLTMPLMVKIQKGLISQPVAIILFFIMSFIQAIIGVYIVEYLAQIVRSTFPKKKKKPLEAKPAPKNEI